MGFLTIKKAGESPSEPVTTDLGDGRLAERIKGAAFIHDGEIYGMWLASIIQRAQKATDDALFDLFFSAVDVEDRKIYGLELQLRLEDCNFLTKTEKDRKYLTENFL